MFLFSCLPPPGTGAVRLCVFITSPYQPFQWNRSNQTHTTPPIILTIVTVTRLAAMKKADYYSILGLEPTATPEEVKRAYRERAKSTHPDASRTADTISEFMKVKEAYETLYDAQRRSEFDRKRKVRGLGVGWGLLGRAGPVLWGVCLKMFQLSH